MNRLRPWLLLSICLPIAGLSAQEQAPARTIAPTDNLVVDGIPPIPAALAVDVRRYTESRGASLSGWHPVEREILISTRFGNTNQLHRVRTPGGARTQLTFFEEPVGGGSYERKTGKYIIFGRDVGGNEFNQLYRYDVATGAVTLLTDGGRSQNGGVNWNNAGDRIAYTRVLPDVEDMVGGANDLVGALSVNDLTRFLDGMHTAWAGRGPQVHDLIGQVGQLTSTYTAQRDDLLRVIDGVAVITQEVAASGDTLWHKRLRGLFSTSPLLVGDKLLRIEIP